MALQRGLLVLWFSLMTTASTRRFSLLASLASDDLQRANELGVATNRTVILALRDDLEAALTRGYRLKALHSRLVGEGVISTDYSSFRRAARSLGLGEDGQPAVVARPSPALPPAPPPAVERSEANIRASLSERRTFTWNPDPDPKDFRPSSVGDRDD